MKKLFKIIEVWNHNSEGNSYKLYYIVGAKTGVEYAGPYYSKDFTKDKLMRYFSEVGIKKMFQEDRDYAKERIMVISKEAKLEIATLKSGLRRLAKEERKELAKFKKLGKLEKSK